eukprot:4167997-Prymnesium_polylepis.1
MKGTTKESGRRQAGGLPGLGNRETSVPSRPASGAPHLPAGLTRDERARAGTGWPGEPQRRGRRPRDRQPEARPR